MEQESISTLRKLATAGSEEALLNLLTRFTPLLNKYARKFDYEDTFSEPQLYFIKLIKTFPPVADYWNDGQTVSYIAKSIYTYYIKLSKQNTFRENNLLEFNPDITDKPIIDDTDFTILLTELFSSLTEWQKTILILHYVDGFSIQEIAQQYNKTRQAINKTKNQALSILQKQFNS